MSQNLAIPHYGIGQPRRGRAVYKIVLAALGAVLLGLGLSIAEPVLGLPAAGAGPAPLPEALPDDPRPELPPEWRWRPEPLRYQHMYPSERTYGSQRTHPRRSSAGLDWIRPNGR